MIAASLTGLAALLATQGLAQQVPSGSPAAVKAGTYRIEPSHTQITFTLSHFGFTEFSGFFSGASGSLRIDPANIAAAKLDVSLPVSSVQTTSGKLDGELRGDQWFDAEKFPVATFTSTKVVRGNVGKATIAGNLTLHGVTRPVILEARFVGAGVNPIDKTETIGFSATGTIKRSEFGVKQYVPLIGDEVHLSISGAFTRAG